VLNYQLVHRGKRFGEIAIELELLTDEDVEHVLKWQRESRPPLGEMLVEVGALARDTMLAELRTYQAL